MHGDRKPAFERRAYPRFKVMLAGLCSVSGGIDVPCDVTDMSMGGAALRVETDASVGAAVILALPQVGLLRGHAAKASPDGLAIAFGEGRPQRERIAGFLTWLVARRLDPGFEDRGHQRLVPLRRVVAVAPAGGPATTARIIDVSRSGVALTTTGSFAIGSTVTIGATAGIVVRLFDGGLAVRFVEPLGADLDATIIL